MAFIQFFGSSVWLGWKGAEKKKQNMNRLMIFKWIIISTIYLIWKFFFIFSFQISGELCIFPSQSLPICIESQSNYERKYQINNWLFLLLFIWPHANHFNSTLVGWIVAAFRTLCECNWHLINKNLIFNFVICSIHQNSTVFIWHNWNSITPPKNTSSDCLLMYIFGDSLLPLPLCVYSVFMHLVFMED